MNTQSLQKLNSFHYIGVQQLDEILMKTREDLPIFILFKI